jgi:hypothetical protein
MGKVTRDFFWDHSEPPHLHNGPDRSPCLLNDWFPTQNLIICDDVTVFRRLYHLVRFSVLLLLHGLDIMTSEGGKLSPSLRRVDLRNCLLSPLSTHYGFS